MTDNRSPDHATDKTRAKYITAAVLVVWVIGLFLFTVFKFSGSGK